jgi:HAD superfamily hydrolase (TIGR01509 family)
MLFEKVLFDFNGTMVNDNLIQGYAWDEFLLNLIGRPLSPQEAKNFLPGLNVATFFRHLFGKELSADQIIKLSEKKEIVYRQKCLDNPSQFCLLPGLAKFLDELKSMHIPINIATSSNINNLKFYFKYLGLSRWFDISKVSFDDGHLLAKPSPDIYLQAAKNINALTTECIVFEDSKNGIYAAQAAHAQKIIGITTSLSEKQLYALNVDYVIDNYSRIDNFLT